MALYSIVSTAGLHYQSANLWDAFKYLRQYSLRFVVQRIDLSGEIHWFDRFGSEVPIPKDYALEKRYLHEAVQVWNFHCSHCRTCQSGARCELGEQRVYELLSVQRAARLYCIQPPVVPTLPRQGF